MVLFPQARAETLRLLFADASRELHLRELVRQSGLTLGSVQAEVSKLLDAGLLLDRRDGNRRYVRANSAHPVFVDLHNLVLKTAGLRDVLLAALNGLEDIRIALVFGSVAAGAEQAGSDIDLLVIGEVGLRVLSPRLRIATELLGREINPVVMSAEEFSRQRATKPLLVDLLAKPKLFILGDERELERLA
ncbi:MAG: nucleotidyltransferase domain-containing protein [Verrucomicrobia bacterium]|nr:nucleotidyltransferase domain-containing protein [Verrucomicrobiota bacterium]